MNRVIITGASGFVGKALTKYFLSHGYTVFAIVRNCKKMEDIEDGQLVVVEAELEEYKGLASMIPQEGYETFFHLAWDGTFGKKHADYHRQLENAAYAADAVLAAAKLGCERFVFAGSIVQTEPIFSDNEGKEKTRNAHIYGAAKAAACTICRTLAAQNSLKYNTAILSSVYGVGDNSNMLQNVLILALLKGESPPLIQSETLYDWIYIEDTVAALVAISERGVSGRAYYVGHTKPSPYKKLIIDTKNVLAPEVELRFGEYQGELSVDYSNVDTEALYRDTGFACRTDFAGSIKKTAEWLLHREKGEGAK